MPVEANVPLAAKVIPPTEFVEIAYDPATVTFTPMTTVFAAAKGTPIAYVPFTVEGVHAVGAPCSVNVAGVPPPTTTWISQTLEP